MAQLGSPGVQVNVIDESFYNPATPGTIPLVVVATAQDKTNASGTGVAVGTTLQNANELYLATSQKDLTDRYGVPTFQKDNSGNAIQGSELNEYGLFAAYSFLGASSSAYILRANVDIGALEGRALAPVGKPADNTYWIDTARTRFGVFQWNSDLQQFTNKVPLILNSVNDVVDVSGADAYKPKVSAGVIGDYAVVTYSDVDQPQDANTLWYKNSSGAWVAVGSAAWSESWPTLTFSMSDVNDDFDVNGSPVVVSGGASAIVTAIGAITGLNAVLVNATTISVYSSGVDVVITGDTEFNGTYKAPATQFSSHTSVPFWNSTDSAPRPTGSVWVKTTEFNLGAKWTVKNYNANTRVFEVKDSPVYVGGEAAIFGLDPLVGGASIPVDSIFVDANFDRDGVAKFKVMYRAEAGATVGTATVPSTTNFVNGNIVISESRKNTATMSSVTIAVTNSSTPQTIVDSIQSSGLVNVTASFDSVTRKLTLTHNLGGEIHLTGAAWTVLGLAVGAGNVSSAPEGTSIDFRISNWKALSTVGYIVNSSEPNDVPADSTLWYASYQNQVDIMVHDGSTWVGYKSYFTDTNPAGPFVQASTPTEQSDGTILVNGDLWVDTSDQDQYGRNIKRWLNGQWTAIDVTDHTSQFGIIFADARWGVAGNSSTAGSIVDLLDVDYVDPDAPDPTAYPRGMLLWNTRRSGFNIKQYRKNYINVNEDNVRFGDEAMSDYFADRWVSVSGQDLNQVAYFGRKAQRAYIVGQLKVAINTNQRILDEDNIFFNLIACPGYPEVISDMVNLNNARNGTALIVGDTPLRLESNAQALINYGSDFANTGIDGEDGLHTKSDHLAVYYPAGLTTDLTGTNVVVPASHMMLRTIAISDQRSFQWFAPAGTRRGGVTNASSVGYIKNGSFVPVSLNQGTRDQMAQVKINPITNIPGAGLVAFGQQTKTGVNSSLDRINVARLVSYLRRQLGIITKPFIFEPNDKQTRSEIKNVCESLMLDLVSLRGIYDFIVVCDETNNTPSVIANNQLYVDIAVEPVKAVEFIYIPLRLKNVGDIKSRQ